MTRHKDGERWTVKIGGVETDVQAKKSNQGCLDCVLLPTEGAGLCMEEGCIDSSFGHAQDGYVVVLAKPTSSDVPQEYVSRRSIR